MSNPRVRKIADRIQVIVAEMLERRIKDPRLGFVTVTDVRVTGDTQQATIFYTVLGEDADLAGTAAALESAKGLIRSEVAKQLGMRHAPTLTFIPDALPETARHLDEVLAKARESDDAVAAARARRDVRRRGRPVQEAARGRRRRRRRRRRPSRVTTESGLVVVDKPGGMTSHDVVARVRRLAGTRKVGHAGTLDPMATGVLVLGVNRATRLLGHLMLTEKAYDATIRLGVATTTDDAEGEVVGDASTAAALDEATVRDALAEFVGDARAGARRRSRRSRSTASAPTQRVRDGEEVELDAAPGHRPRARRARRPARRRASSTSTSRVRCSSGTYIRAIARDLGAGSGVGGHLTALRRTAVGPYGLAVAHTLDELAEDFAVLPIAEAARAGFPAVDLRRAGRRRPRRPRARPRPAGPDGACSPPTASSWRSTSRATAGPGPSRSSSERPADSLPPCRSGAPSTRSRPTSAAPSWSIGNFDGVHLGHRHVLARAREIADERGLPVVAVTFDPHPMAVLRPEHAPTDADRRSSAAPSCSPTAGVDARAGAARSTATIAGWTPGGVRRAGARRRPARRGRRGRRQLPLRQPGRR